MTIVEMARDTRDTARDIDPADLGDDEKRDRARADCRADPALTGTDLGARYGMSAEWGRKQKRAAARPAGTPTARPAVQATVPPGTAPAQRSARPTVPTVPAPARHAARPKKPAGTRHWADTAVVLIVALVAAAASYGHMRHVALMAGEADWLAWLFPLTVDGLAVAALRRGEQGRAWLVLALAVSVSANVGAQFPEAVEVAAPVVFAWPPLALYGTHRLLRMGH